VHEDAIAPRGVVAGDERVLGVDQRSERPVEELGVGLGRLVERDDCRALGPLNRRLGRSWLVGVDVEA
jgi:hypothetical protein